MKLSRRRLLGVLGLGLFGGTLAKANEEPKVDVHEFAKALEQPLRPIYCSKEAMEDIMRWNVDQIDEQTRKEIYNSPGLVRLYGKATIR